MDLDFPVHDIEPTEIRIERLELQVAYLTRMVAELLKRTTDLAEQ